MTPDVLAQHAMHHGHRLAIIDDRPGSPPRKLTYWEFNQYVNRIANGLIGSAIEPGAKVMWLGPNSLEVAAFGYAARKAGLVSVPLNYRLTAEEAVYVINDSDAVVIFADVGFAAFLDRLRPELHHVRDIVIFADPERLDSGGYPLGIVSGQIAECDWLGEAHEPVGREDAAAVMIYTSGTTGKPKGAYRAVRPQTEQRSELLKLLDFDQDDVYLTCGPLYHSGPGVFASYAFLVGATVVVQYRFDPEDWLRLLTTYQATATFAAPTPIREILTLAPEVKVRYDTSSMRTMLANAAPWPFALKESYLEYFPADSLWEVYGATELGISTVLEPADQLRKPGSCGRAAPHVAIALFDEDGQLVEHIGETGELYVQAASVFDTYYKAQADYDEDHRDGWHTVGDIAYFDEEGYYYICDRKNDVIITGGMSVYPAEIEAVLEEHPGIYEAAVIGVPSKKWGESVVAVIVPADPELREEDVLVYAGVRLAGYKKPRRIEFVSGLPKTGSNKILKRELRERFG